MHHCTFHHTITIALAITMAGHKGKYILLMECVGFGSWHSSTTITLMSGKLKVK